MRFAIILIGYCVLVPHCLAGYPAETELSGMVDAAFNCTADANVTSEWGIQPNNLLPLHTSDWSLADARIQPNVRRNWSLVGAYGYESFRGVADQGWQNNGLYGGVNFGTRLGSFSDATGLGFQAGITLGLYDWKGNPYRPDWSNQMRQDFVSYGLFKRATEQAPFTLGITQDWMFTDNSTTYGLSLEVSQVRYRAGYVASASNEYGITGAFRVIDETNVGISRPALANPGALPDQFVTTRPLNHISAYWHHKWSDGGPNTIISIGIPEKDRASGDGSLGDFLATATINVPFSDKVGFLGNVMYMNPSAPAGFEAGHEDTWSFTVGIEIFPGSDARSTTIAGERWMPLLPVANNGVFLLDAGWWQR